MEHKRLRRPGFNCQIKVEQDDKGREHLVYYDDLYRRQIRVELALSIGIKLYLCMVLVIVVGAQ